MSKGTYVGVSGVAHKVKNIYAGMGGVAHKVKKVYVGVNGVAKLAYSGSAQYKVLIGRASSATSVNNSIYETINKPPVNDFISVAWPLPSSYTSAGGGTVSLLYDKKRDQFIAFSQDYYVRNTSSPFALKFPAIFVKKSDATTWTSVGNIPEPSTNYFAIYQTSYQSIFIDDDGYFYIPISNIATSGQSGILYAKYYIENNTITLVGTGGNLQYMNTMQCLDYTSKITKFEDNYCLVTCGPISSSPYRVYLQYTSDIINSAWTVVTLFNYSTSNIPNCFCVDHNFPIYKYNGVYYALVQIMSGGVTMYLLKGTSLSNMTRQTGYINNIKNLAYPYMFKDNKAYICYNNGMSSTTGYTAKGIYSIILDTSAWNSGSSIATKATKESDSTYGIVTSGSAGGQNALAYIDDGTNISIFTWASTSSTTVHVYYTPYGTEFTDVNCGSVFGNVSPSSNPRFMSVAMVQPE